MADSHEPNRVKVWNTGSWLSFDHRIDELHRFNFLSKLVQNDEPYWICQGKCQHVNPPTRLGSKEAFGPAVENDFPPSESNAANIFAEHVDQIRDFLSVSQWVMQLFQTFQEEGETFILLGKTQF